jgi:hypothetical protein
MTFLCTEEEENYIYNTSSSLVSVELLISALFPSVGSCL